jgi:hypothetical protein
MLISVEMDTDKIKGSGYTYRDYYERVFIPHLQKRNVTRSTLASFATVWKKIVQSGFADRELTDLPTIEAVKAWLSEMPPAAAEQAAKCYKAPLLHAYDNGLFDSVPFGGRSFIKSQTKKKVMLWNATDLARAIIRMEGHRLEGYMLATVGAGLRKEESLDILIERDIEIEDRPDGSPIVWINVDSAFTAHDGEKEAKNEMSIRCVPITGEIAERLISWLDGRTGYLAQNLEGGRLGITGLRKTWDLLFRGAIEKRPGVRGSCYKPPAPLHGFKRITPNKLRHINITFMSKLKITGTIVSKFHGQVPETITGSSYYLETWHDEAYVSAADELAEFMRPAFARAHQIEGR